MELTMALHRLAQISPDQPLTVCGDRVRTAAESADRVVRFAGALRSLGVADGDRVGIVALNSDRYHEYMLAVPWAGAVVNPVNIRWSPAEIAYSLRESDTSVLLVDDAFAKLVPALHAEWDGLRHVIFCGDGEQPDGTSSYEQLIHDAQPVDDARRGGDDLYGLFYTGGTTGHPKGVMLSHNAMMVSAMGTLATLPEVLTRHGRLLHAAPMFHLADIAIWNIGLLIGTTHVIVPQFTPAEVINAIGIHRVTDSLLVPTMIQTLVDSPEAETADLSSVRSVIYGASPISQAVLDRAHKTFPSARFTQAYGMTELAPIATLLSPADHDDPELCSAAGRPAAHVQLKIVDPDGVEVPRGEVGEVVVRGDNVMQGYWNRPEDTAEALRGGWMHTGDGAYMDERGYVFIVDRIKDMIITGGENVYSGEVENALAKHEAVATCAVVGIPDEKFGERVHAVVVLRAGAQVLPQELTDFCRPLIANYKVPRSFAFVDALPMSGAGKVLKRDLRKTFWDEGGRQIS
ncbi:fatty-acid--CoA ligase [Mycobacterium sp. CBMA 234]|uniref:acyl-CoA synthetase n=1 Tax=Mycolicibacterium sp. CBMA 234 TaxID=1918495 RepID=UPI0012DEC8E6|nr:long-chain fatty acid--CoA ligase [Mycolicibacterium sp. CBMA 234]MUL67121.1 fatty-acid--CoA ligase [Mycolicibacterium sp. CBMA 234]